MLSRIQQKGNWLVYGATALYVLYVFSAQWSASALRMENGMLNSLFSLMVNIAYLTALALSICKILVNFQYYVRRKWFSILSVVMIILVAIATQTPSLTLPLVIGLASFSVTNRSLAKIVCFFIGLFLSVSIVLSFMGLKGGDKNSKPLLGEDSASFELVTSIGLSNPNSVMLIFFSVMTLALYLCRTNFQYFLTSIAAVSLVCVFSVATSSTTGLLIGTATVILMTLSRYRSRVRYLLGKLTPHMFLIVTILSFVVAINFGAQENSVNSLLTNRPALWNLRVEDNSYINFFGNNDAYLTDFDPEATERYYALDNMPLYTLVHYGVLVYLIFLFIFYVGSKKIREPGIIVFVFMSCLLMFSERLPLYGFVLLFLQKAIMDYYLVEKGLKK